MILAGDIGSTKTTLALFEERAGQLFQVHGATFPSGEYCSFADILVKFLKRQPGLSLHAACFGAAGPVIDGTCQVTNLPWTLEEAELARAIGISRVKMLN